MSIDKTTQFLFGEKIIDIYDNQVLDVVLPFGFTQETIDKAKIDKATYLVEKGQLFIYLLTEKEEKLKKEETPKPKSK